ncbi:hypothetical protein ACRALDRAFT_206567 [Sodiomyces alcalophilus JCM 7366]|uniref:uncharacterized protein n=1 Tax=Sodiomyces alcalophilus JCM 7366 TaxID=591952 RepID=UPI0039B6D596
MYFLQFPFAIIKALLLIEGISRHLFGTVLHGNVQLLGKPGEMSADIKVGRTSSPDVVGGFRFGRQYLQRIRSVPTSYSVYLLRTRCTYFVLEHPEQLICGTMHEHTIFPLSFACPLTTITTNTDTTQNPDHEGLKISDQPQ